MLFNEQFWALFKLFKQGNDSAGMAFTLYLKNKLVH